MTAAMMAVNRPAPKSTNAGRMYTNDGSVWAISRMGRSPRAKRSLRADAMPSATPMASVMIVATITWTSVSMLSCHRLIR